VSTEGFTPVWCANGVPKVGLIARECLTEGAVGEAGADAVALFDHGCAHIATGQRPCHLVATHMASAVAPVIHGPAGGPVAKARHIQRAAAPPLSSGRVLKAMAACGAIRWTALTTASNSTSPLRGRRTPAPITTQS